MNVIGACHHQVFVCMEFLETHHLSRQLLVMQDKLKKTNCPSQKFPSFGRTKKSRAELDLLSTKFLDEYINASHHGWLMGLRVRRPGYERSGDHPPFGRRPQI